MLAASWRTQAEPGVEQFEHGNPPAVAVAAVECGPVRGERSAQRGWMQPEQDIDGTADVIRDLPGNARAEQRQGGVHLESRGGFGRRGDPDGSGEVVHLPAYRGQPGRRGLGPVGIKLCARRADGAEPRGALGGGGHPGELADQVRERVGGQCREQLRHEQLMLAELGQEQVGLLRGSPRRVGQHVLLELGQSRSVPRPGEHVADQGRSPHRHIRCVLVPARARVGEIDAPVSVERTGVGEDPQPGIPVRIGG